MAIRAYMQCEACGGSSLTYPSRDICRACEGAGVVRVAAFPRYIASPSRPRTWARFTHRPKAAVLADQPETTLDRHPYLVALLAVGLILAAFLVVALIVRP